MRFSSAFFASLAAQAVFAQLPTVPAKTGVKSLDVILPVVYNTEKSVKAQGDAIGTSWHALRPPASFAGSCDFAYTWGRGRRC